VAMKIVSGEQEVLHGQQKEYAFSHIAL